MIETTIPGGILHRGASQWSNLKGCWAGRYTWGYPGPLNLLSNLLQLEQWPVYLFGLSWIQWEGRLIFQPPYLLL